MQRLPPFQDFITYAGEHIDEISYDTARSAGRQARLYPNYFSNEEFGVISEIIAAMMTAYIRQYHQWLSAQLQNKNLNNND